jgi:acyl-CoA synthetase (AMP-forming)/AMP-acid ligase II
MIVGGENVFPIEIERILVEHPTVAEAAVIGARDEVRGEVPIAFVCPVEGAELPEESELRSYCRARLAGYKVPRWIHMESDLPRGPTGKILKRALKAKPD